MVPVQIAVLGALPTRVPVASDTFWIGRDTSCDLCLWDLRVSRRHAKLRHVRGEYVLSAEGKHGVGVNGKRVTVLNLKHGDEIALTPPGVPDPVRLKFENALEGVFGPPDVPISTVWLARDEAKASGTTILGRYDLFGPLDESGATGARRAKDRETGQDVAVETLGAVADGREGDQFLRFATAVTGASHPSVVRILEVGLSRYDTGAVRWIATEIVRGRPASKRIAEGPQPPVTAVRRLRSLASGLTLLHARGVVYGGVEAASVVLRPDGGATLSDLSSAFLAKDGPLSPAKPLRDPAYAAPESLRADSGKATAAGDVFGLGVLGYAMLVGSAPPAGGSSRPAMRPLSSILGATVPEAIEDALAKAMALDPAARPTAAEFGEALANGALNLGARAVP